MSTALEERGERRGWLGRVNRREGSEEQEREEGDVIQLCVCAECLSLFSGCRRGTRQRLCEVRGNLHRLREMEEEGGGRERERDERVCYQGPVTVRVELGMRLLVKTCTIYTCTCKYYFFYLCLFVSFLFCFVSGWVFIYLWFFLFPFSFFFLPLFFFWCAINVNFHVLTRVGLPLGRGPAVYRNDTTGTLI